MKSINFTTLIISSIFVTSCSLPEAINYNVTHALGKSAPQSAPPVVGKRKIGKPYQVFGRWYYPLQSSEGYRKYGVASWYGDDFHGKKTANGETYNMYEYTAAHKTLPLPTYARVTNTQNGKSIVVKINDRGPFVKERLIDLSYAGAKALGMHKKGTAPVIVESISVHGGYKGISKGQTAEAPKVKRQYRPYSKFKSVPFTVRVSNRGKNINTPSTKTNNYVPPTSQGKYYIQFAAFEDVNNARKYFYQINNIRGLKIKPVMVNQKTYYKIVLENLNDLAQAEIQLQNFKANGFSNAILRKY